MLCIIVCAIIDINLIHIHKLFPFAFSSISEFQNALNDPNCPINDSLTHVGSKISLFVVSKQPFPRHS